MLPTSPTSRTTWPRRPDAENRSRRQAARGAARRHGDGRDQQARRLRAALLLSPQAFDRRQLPHVPGRGREGAEAAAGLRHPGHRRHESVDQFARRQEGAERSDGIPADQPPARLPDLRPGRRMPAAGPRGRLRPQQLALHRGKARGAAQGARTAGRRRGDEPLHPVHALRALRAGDRRQDGARPRRTRREGRDRLLRRPHAGVRALRQHDRPVPGRRPDLRAVSLHGEDLGTRAAQVGFAARWPRLEPRRAGEAVARDARAAAR